MKQNNPIPAIWQPPPYHVRISQKAKSLRFRISPKKGLEIVLPRHQSLKGVEALLYEHRHWIEKHFSRLNLPTQPVEANVNPADSLPTEIALRAIEQMWQVECILYEGKTKLIERPDHHLVLLYTQGNEQQALRSCQRWVRDKAKEHLLPWLTQLSTTYALPFERATIRAQQTRWGSCSEDKAITLNLKCLFFPPQLARYVMIHELCHTLHLNHSRQFWQSVAQYDPEYKIHDKLLKKDRQFIPAWLDHD